ncbi:conjugal transfer protein TraM [Enterobacteriaceae bacterium H11S18]|uniref:relaxosome protein TraM n=1 Tax=Dryocola clanedunensis TaxID=2925396 RepID=UPI0022F02693|nr:relaxosome protein TraM [Dryocola clanedunensis]MCT4709166.1 conjugal transfer protein TraM [Dryocola clanedunensis]
MPRQNVYMKQKTLDGIRELVDKRLAEGATSADANISSMCSELIEIGLRIMLHAKDHQEDENDFDERIYQRAVLEECVKARQASQEVFRMMYDLTEIKGDTRHNFSETVQILKQKAGERVNSILPEEE